MTPTYAARRGAIPRSSSHVSGEIRLARFDRTFQRGQAKGDTLFASSGDDGSVGVTRAHHQTTTSPDPQVSYPNVSPYVTSVGGTQVQYGWTWNPTQDKPFNSDGSRNPVYWAWTPGGSTEPVWNESWEGIATGGGLSTVYGRPAYQDSVAGVVGAHRGVPDLSWNAAVNGGVLVYRTFFPAIDGPPSWAVYGGTSAASPQAAAMTAIANQCAEGRRQGPDRRPQHGDLQRRVLAGGRVPRHRRPHLRDRAQRRPEEQPDLGHRRRRVRHA